MRFDTRPYRLLAPTKTHTRAGTCEEAGCLAHHNGWVTTIDESTAIGRQQAGYIRYNSGRRFTESRDGSLTCFTFEAGQRCFAEHRIRLEREPLYVIGGSTTGGNEWIDRFNDRSDAINEMRDHG